MVRAKQRRMNQHPSDEASTPPPRSADVHVRLYTPADRPAIRRLCWETGDRGRPLEEVFSDRETVADLLTRYYTDEDSTATWVAESQGGVVGYLTGCLDDVRYRQAMLRRILPHTVGWAIRRGALGRLQTWRLLCAIALTWRRGGFDRPPLVHDQYPAHLHLNLQDGFRGRQIGQRLLESFLAQARRERVAGMHAAVRSTNHRACRFFERSKFAVLSRHPSAMLGAAAGGDDETILYGLRL